MNTFDLFDMTWVTPEMSQKGGYRVKRGGIGQFAYVFTAQKELVADLHNPKEGRDSKRFHHSSFTSGLLIRCAGMIGGVQGEVKHIDNDSGHYWPPIENLARLVKYLNKRGVFANDAQVEEAETRKVLSIRDFLGGV